jgi:acyl-CoA synthetase (AMP-forming)/AMP-acid ligase II
VFDDRVLVMLPDGPGFVDAFAGAMQQGAVPLPVNPLLSVREVVTVTTGGRCPVGGGLGRSDV